MAKFAVFLTADTQTPSTLAWTTNALSNGTEGVAYSAPLSATGGTTPYTFTKVSGAFPDGINITQTAGAWFVSGTPTTFGTFSVTLRVTDANSQTSDRPFAFTINSAPTTLTILTNTLNSLTGTVGTQYTSTTFQAAGGTAPYTWSVVGTAPNGLTIGDSSGIFGGTPTVANTFNFSIRVTDNVAATATSGSFTVVISAAGLSIVTTTLPSATVGTPYGVNPTVFLQAANGTPPYSGWQIINKPSWMTLNASTGQITGTPDTEATLELDAIVNDAAAGSASRDNIILRVFDVGEGEAGNAYYLELSADPNCTQAVALTTQASIDSVTRAGWTPNAFWKIPGAAGTPATWDSDYNAIAASYPMPPGDYATCLLPPRRTFSSRPWLVAHQIYATFAPNHDVGDEGLDNKAALWFPTTTTLNNPGYPTTSNTFCYTFDCYLSKTLWDNKGPAPGGTLYTTAWKLHFTTIGPANNKETTKNFTCEHTPFVNQVDIDNGILAKTKQGPIGGANVVPPPGFTGVWAQYYNPTNSPDYPVYQTFPLRYNMWVRYWYFWRFNVDADNPAEFVEWKAQPGGSALTGIWDQCSIAMADEITDPRWEYYRVPTRRAGTDTHIKTVNPCKMNSSTNNTNNPNDGLAAPVVVKLRYFVVLKDYTDATLEMRRPVP